jgi:predicted phage terminase large subunit-like protein
VSVVAEAGNATPLVLVTVITPVLGTSVRLSGLGNCGVTIHLFDVVATSALSPIIQRSWLRFYDVLPPRNASPSFVLQSWDTASKIGGGNDWSVCTTWLIQDGKYFLIHILRERLDYPSLRERAIAHARAHQTNKIVVEDSGIGTGIIQELYRARLPVVAVRPERNKKTRMQLQSAKFRDGLVYLPRQAPGLASYVSELLAFPNVRFDDQVDSTSQALACVPSTYNLAAMNRGMGELISALAFQRMFG